LSCRAQTIDNIEPGEEILQAMDIPKAARGCIDETGALIGRLGPRLAGSAACAEAARVLSERLAAFCDSAGLESFEVHPDSFYSYTRILPLAYALGMAALALPRALAILPALGLVAGIVIMVSQFGVYSHFPDLLFPGRRGWNVSAVVEPTGPAARELILSGHHDSAPVARIFSSPFARLYAPAIFLPYAFFLLELGLLAARLAGAGSRPWAWIALAAGVPAVLGYFLLVDTRRGSPGAGDNLVASMMVLELARSLAESRTTSLASTRLRILSFDAEEAGLRGSSAWFREHAPQLSGLPCFHLNFDSLYALRDLQVLTSDVNGLVALDPGMAADLVACAADGGHSLRPYSMLFGGGATDAAEGSRAGIRASTIIAMPTDIVRDGLVYHTARDTADSIEPEAIEACMGIALRYLARLETGAMDGLPHEAAPNAACAELHCLPSRRRRGPSHSTRAHGGPTPR